MKRLLSLTCLLIGLYSFGKPVRNTYTIFTQPDGQTFTARTVGDEFCKIKTTKDGCSIIKDENGWWCYAIYEPDGTKYSSGYRVGEDAPYDVLSASRDIPHAKLNNIAAMKRMAGSHSEREPILKRIKQQNETSTAIQKHGIVILAEFQDTKFTYEKQDFEELLTGENYIGSGTSGCAMDYFNDQFEGLVDFSFDVSEIVTLSHNYAYYGANDYSEFDIRPHEMVVEACLLASEAGIDFSKYDDDNDGYIDNVFVFFAGKDEAEVSDNEDLIWSHAWYVVSGAGMDPTYVNGKIIDRYACTSELRNTGYGFEINSIGSFCHEYSHTLGLPDFYDTDYDSSGGYAAGLWGSTSLMDSGNYNNYGHTPPFYNAIERYLAGISEPVTLDRNGSYTLKPIHQGGTCYKLNTDNEYEFYLFECRINEDWDKYIGGSGLLVYHIDMNDTRKWINYNTVNANPYHQCADLVEADSRNDKLTYEEYVEGLKDISGVFFPYNSTNYLSGDSDPGLKFWSGEECEISIKDISFDGKKVTFSVSGFEGSAPPEVASLHAEAFMDAAIIQFESSYEYDGEATIQWKRPGEEEQTLQVKPYEPGKYSITLENLTPGNKTYMAHVSFTLDGVQGAGRNISFMTSRAAPVTWPYIYLGKIETNPDGSLPPGSEIALRIYNATDAEACTWTFNDNHIEPGGNGYYKVNESGFLRAYVYWKDGSLDILEKEIFISE